MHILKISHQMLLHNYYEVRYEANLIIRLAGLI